MSHPCEYTLKTGDKCAKPSIDVLNIGLDPAAPIHRWLCEDHYAALAPHVRNVARG